MIYTNLPKKIMPIDLNRESTPVNPEDAKYLTMLANLQGGILKSHGRFFAAHVFLTFAADASKVRRWLSTFTARYVTSALRQHYETKEYRVNRISGRLFGGIYLSAAGYKNLGCEDLDKFVEEESPKTQTGICFKDGMANFEFELGDKPRSDWEANFRDNQIDALILLADDDAERLKDTTARVQKSLKGTAKFFAQHGAVLRPEGKAIEPFGYRDGISETVFIQEDVEKARQAGFDVWDSFAPLKLALVKDPLTEKEDCFGSYLVYRKLEQNVKKFKESEKELAETLNIPEDKRELIGALMVGRFKNGVPVELSATADADENLIDFNNFGFVSDNEPSKNRCPYHSHIRRMNPRKESAFGKSGETVEEELEHRIVRRGIAYDHRERDAAGKLLHEGDPEKDVGLLFMCFQSSIPKQFGFMQTIWANATNFFGEEGNGIDNIIGQNSSLDETSFQRWNARWGEDDDEPKSFCIKDCVTFKGGEFFFAPSIAFLRDLSEKV